MSDRPPKRWLCVATYRVGGCGATITHAIEELYELHDFIERGPDWNALIDIRITLARPTSVGEVTLGHNERRH